MTNAATPSRLVGILGGMGPAATADFYSKLIELTPAAVDQDHLRVVMWADPTVPSRQEALLANGTDPTPWLMTGVDQLERCGAEIVVVPCNTVHGYLPPVMEQRNFEFISIIDTTIESIPSIDTREPIGLLATDGALASDIYQSALRTAGYEVALPSREEQRELMQLVYDVKAGVTSDLLRQGLNSITRSLKNQGATFAIAGCTELSTLLEKQRSTNGLQIIDPATELARETIFRAMANSGTVLTT